MTEYHRRFLAKTDSEDPNISVGWSYHCQFEPKTSNDGLSLSVSQNPTVMRPAMMSNSVVVDTGLFSPNNLPSVSSEGGSSSL
jgi:hypothetical protein